MCLVFLDIHEEFSLQYFTQVWLVLGPVTAGYTCPTYNKTSENSLLGEEKYWYNIKNTEIMFIVLT